MTKERRVFPAKKSATQVKHYILENFLSAWGGIIINSNRRIRLAFVDTCCGSGLYEVPVGERDDSELPYDMGSAMIGLKKLAELEAYGSQRGKTVSTKALLINKLATELTTLEEAIKEHFATPPEHKIRHGRFENLYKEVLSFCGGWFSFVFIDPYGPKPIPFRMVSAVVTSAYTDTMINFPYLSFQKWSGFLDRKDLKEDQKKKLLAVDAFMGGKEWRQVARNAKKLEQDLDQCLLQHYMGKLSSRGVRTMSVPLLFESKERVIYHLVFTSHNVAGLVAAKEKFIKGERHQDYLRQQKKVEKTKQLAFDFSTQEEKENVDINSLAEHLYNQFSNKSVTLEEVISLAIQLPSVLESHVRRALTSLKRSKRATYSKTRYQSVIRFL